MTFRNALQKYANYFCLDDGQVAFIEEVYKQLKLYSLNEHLARVFLVNIALRFNKGILIKVLTSLSKRFHKKKDSQVPEYFHEYGLYYLNKFPLDRQILLILHALMGVTQLTARDIENLKTILQYYFQEASVQDHRKAYQIINYV